ncbi:MAG TPA: hypothetical protein VIU33_09410 [Nitrospiria bacterium]
MVSVLDDQDIDHLSALDAPSCPKKFHDPENLLIQHQPIAPTATGMVLGVKKSVI